MTDNKGLKLISGVALFLFTVVVGIAWATAGAGYSKAIVNSERITKVETIAEVSIPIIQRDMKEIKSDIKELLRK